MKDFACKTENSAKSNYLSEKTCGHSNQLCGKEIGGQSGIYYRNWRASRALMRVEIYWRDNKNALRKFHCPSRSSRSIFQIDENINIEILIQHNDIRD